MADDSNSAPPSQTDEAASRTSPDAGQGSSVTTTPPPPDAGATTHVGADIGSVGRRIGRDEIDPELIGLPRFRGRIGPLLGFSMVVFSAYIMLRLSDDLVFSRQGSEPTALPSAAALLERDDIDNLHARVPAVPDRSFATRVQASRSNQGSRLAPVQGTSGRLWLMIDGSVWTAGIRYEEVYTGRVRELDDMPFAEPLREHVAQREPAPRFVTPEAVRKALSERAGTVVSPAGDAIEVAADTPVRVYETAPDRVRIEVIATERMPDAAAWSQVLAEIGLIAPGTAAEPGASPGTWLFTAPATGDLDAIKAALLDAKLVAARALPLEIVHETTWGQLEARDDALVVAGKAVPWRQISWVTPVVRRPVPDDAWVLIADEPPASYWYVLPLFALLGISALLFAWALVRALRSRGEAAVAAVPPASA
jgi:hypothetical protein